MWWKSNLHEVLGLIVTTRTASHFNFLFFPSSAMAASSSQPETMKAECSLDNPKVHSFFLILFTISCILFPLHYIQCHFMPFEENFTIIWWCVPKRNRKSCEMLCKNCFHQENGKTTCNGVIVSFWCMGAVKIKKRVEITFRALNFVCLINNKRREYCWHAWLIPIWSKGFVSKDTVIRITMMGNWSDWKIWLFYP